MRTILNLENEKAQNRLWRRNSMRKMRSTKRGRTLCKNTAHRFYENNKEEVLRKCREYYLRVRETVLARYGPKGQRKCCWSECPVTELEWLTLDHINDDGHSDRGKNLYTKLFKLPKQPGYQTLCRIHQWEKETQRLRRLYESGFGPFHHTT